MISPLRLDATSRHCGHMSPGFAAASASGVANALLNQMRNPPGTLRTMPLWVWNGEMTEQRITEMLEQFAANGIGGVYVHPRPGLITEYLGNRWFGLWSYALSECKRLGLICNVYDENSYPAGFAGGHVPSQLPHAAVQYAWAEIHERAPLRWTGELLTAYRLLDGHAPVLVPLDSTALNALLAEGERLLTIELRTATGNRWTAGFPYVDLTRPEGAEAFLITTYEAYAARFGNDFGKSIQAFFCDEPLLGMVAAGNCGAVLPMSRYIIAEFSREHRYDILPRLGDLFLDHEGSAATRFDYFTTIQRLFTHNFLKPLYHWCETRNVAFTGHYMEHEWPDPFFHPNTMDAYRWMHIPGIDLLAPQFHFAAPENAALYLMTVKEVASVAHQLGRERVMCETHGVGGHEATFEDFKRLGDWLMVHGVDHVVQHLSFQTISGARKHDHPQTFSDHSPWWGEYRLHADHVAKLTVAVKAGARISRLLVLQPTTSGWIHGSPFSEASSDARKALRESQSALVQFLADHQVDFDLGDELILADMATVTAAPRLRVGKADYQLLVVPHGMENWCESTLILLGKWLEAGGVILSLGAQAPSFINGRPDMRAQELASRFPDHFVVIASLEELQTELDRRLEPLVTTDTGDHLPPLVAYQARSLENRAMLHLLVNSGTTIFSGNLRFLGNYVYACDIDRAELHQVSLESVGGYVIAPLTLHSAGHALLISSDDEIPASITAPASSWSLVHPARMTAARLQPNVLAMDYCDLLVNGTTTPGLYVTHANKLLWQQHGFDGDPWDRSVQFRRNTLEHKFEPDSGFLAIYRFEVQTDAIPSLQQGARLAMENPHLVKVRFNGTELDFTTAERWLDETIRAVNVGHLLRAGENEVRVSTEPFHPLCEIDRIYLLGDFALQPAAQGFDVAPPKPISIGDWTKQGLVMYNGSVRYQTHFTLAAPASRLRLALQDWKGSVAIVFINGRRVGTIAWPPYECTADVDLRIGEHVIAVEVVGTLKNLLGPHFCKEPLPRRWTTPAAWDTAPTPQPPGHAYEILPYGLLKAPIIEVAPA